MVEVRQTVVFRAWLDGLRDERAQARIAQRILRLQAGLMGDVRPVGGGVAEMRVDYGAGYRVYFVQRGQVLVVLLCGGTKGGQKCHIRRAHEMAVALEDEGW